MSKTYDVMVEGRNWKSYGAVTFQHMDIGNNLPSGEEVRAGYYPCYGMVFEAIKPDSMPLPGRVPHWWPGKDGVQWRPVPDRKVRTLKFKVHNATADQLSAVRLVTGQDAGQEDPKKYPQFPPQVLMEKTFLDAYEALTFMECADNLLVSTPLFLEQVVLRDRDGNFVRIDKNPYSVVFHVTHHVNASDPNKISMGMIQRAFWSDGYVATYGCCIP